MRTEELGSNGLIMVKNSPGAIPQSHPNFFRRDFMFRFDRKALARDTHFIVRSRDLGKLDRV